jgi:hypothetical protein
LVSSIKEKEFRYKEALKKHKTIRERIKERIKELTERQKILALHNDG